MGSIGVDAEMKITDPDPETSPLTAEDAAAVARAVKARAGRRGKRNIRQAAALPLHPSAAANSSATVGEEARLAACLAAYEAMPAASAYARHRRRVLQKAIGLLRTKR